MSSRVFVGEVGVFTHPVACVRRCAMRTAARGHGALAMAAHKDRAGVVVAVARTTAGPARSRPSPRQTPVARSWCDVIRIIAGFNRTLTRERRREALREQLKLF